MDRPTGLQISASMNAAEQARSWLSLCLRIEAEAEQALGAADAAIWKLRDAAADPSQDDEAVEAFAAWLPQGRRMLSAAQAAVDRAVSETVRARAIMAHAQAVARTGEAAE